MSTFPAGRLGPSLCARVSELFEDAGEPGRAVAGLLTSSSNPKATLQWLARSSAASILVEHVRSERVASHADLDAIAVSGLAGCREARVFLLWAIGQQLIGLPASAVPSPRAGSPAETEDHSVRGALARRLLHGDDAPPDIRVAGLLVVLFGQHLSRVVRLDRAAARTDPPAIKLGRDWLDLPDPMGQHLKDLVNARSPGTTVFGDDHWLFPG